MRSTVTGRLSSTSGAAAVRNRYCVPREWAGQMVSKRDFPIVRTYENTDQANLLVLLAKGDAWSMSASAAYGPKTAGSRDGQGIRGRETW